MGTHHLVERACRLHAAGRVSVEKLFRNKLSGTARSAAPGLPRPAGAAAPRQTAAPTSPLPYAYLAGYPRSNADSFPGLSTPFALPVSSHSSQSAPRVGAAREWGRCPT